MSSKSMAMSPPHFGIGFDSKMASDRRRKSRIHSGSLFISEICRTTSSFSPLRALKTPVVWVTKSYLLISPTWSLAGRVSVAIFKPL